MKKLAGISFLIAGALLSAQDRADRGARQQKIDVQSYLIDAQVDPRAQTLNATVMVRFIPLEDTSQVTFELNNALNISKVTDEDGRQVPSSRLAQDMAVKLSLPQTLKRGKVAALTFVYDGKLSGDEESPVFGIKFAAIHPEVSYLLYPSRWFPVNDYSTDRFSSDLKVTVPEGYKVVASGTESKEGAAFRYKYEQSSFPGSFAVVRGEAQMVPSGGIKTYFYFRDSSSMVQAYGDEIGKAISFFTSIYGVPPRLSLTVVETEAGAANGYSAPGMIFLSPNGIGKQVNLKLVANQVSRQWFGTLVSPTTRNHMWLENGMARYSEILYTEHVNGSGAMDNEIHDAYVEALTVDQPPMIQAARLEDYSPEYWATTGGKGAAVLQMLRNVLGDDQFMKVLKEYPTRFAWKSANTDDFHKICEEAYGQSLNWFFQQWVESSGAPEFKMEYTVFRTQKGFRVMGKITQDLDLFRMPVTLRVETEGNPEEKTIEVVGTSSEFVVETYGKPKNIVLDPKGLVLRFSTDARVAVAIRKGEQFVEIADYGAALKEYQKALDVARNSSLAHFRIGQVHFLEGNWSPAANEFRESLNGDLVPKWTEVWSHIYLGKIFDVSDQRDRALNEYRQAARTKDNTQGALDEAAKYTAQKYEKQRTTN
ncbi:MAG TPA: M1 family aminopeptidase [Bryobacteraceae bacterium]|jgi:tetratricopeptide (TPR) repeat protein|nr:M1 family aminopeptidase [Bryobacteraceae bacterium]